MPDTKITERLINTSLAITGIGIAVFSLLVDRIKPLRYGSIPIRRSSTTVAACASREDGTPAQPKAEWHASENSNVHDDAGGDPPVLNTYDGTWIGRR